MGQQIAELSIEHREQLRSSGLTDNSIKEYGFMTVTAEQASEILGKTFNSGGLDIPYPGIDYHRIRPDSPRLDNGKPIRYESPIKEKFPDGNALFITHLAEDVLGDISIPLYITEGEKKAIALEQIGLSAISISGVWNWRSLSKDKKINNPIKMLTELPLKDRTIYIIFDSDKFNNDNVMQAERGLARCLSSAFGAKIKIVNLNPEFGKGADDQLLKLSEEDFKDRYIKKAVDFDPDNPKTCQIINSTTEEVSFHAISCTDLKVLNVPPVEYLVEGMLQKGLNMINGDSEVGKTNFALNLAIEMTTGSSTFLDRFAITQCRVLYCDLEMGISALKQRIGLLLAGLGKEWPESLQVISPGTDEGFEFDLKSEATQKNIEREIVRVKPDVLFLDTLFDSSSYDLISAKESLELKKYLKKIRSQFDLPVVLIHHKRKPSGDNKFPSSGKHEMWGSVVIPAACDRIISLAGTSDEISVVCSKARNGVKFGSFIMKLCADKPKDATKLWFEYVGEYKEKGSKVYTDEQVVQVFESFGRDRVSKTDLVARSGELKCYGWDKLKERLEATKHYIAVKEGKEAFMIRCEEAEVIDEKE